jgi:hypothetical protein
MNRKLGSFETAQAVTNEYFPFNAVIILRLINGPSEDTLKKIVSLLQRRQPLLRVHLEKNKKQYFFESEKTPSIPLRVIERESDEHWILASEDELNQVIDYRTGPLARLTYILGKNLKQESEIIMTVHHAVIDAPSVGNLIHELLYLCSQVESHAFSEDPDILELIPSAEEFFPPSFRGINRRWHNLLFFFRQLGDEFRYRRHTKGKRTAPIHAEGRGRILPMQLSTETTEVLCKTARKKRITINSLFAASILMAVHKHLYMNQNVPLRTFSFANLRPYLKPPLGDEYLGSYFSMMRFTVDMKEDPRIWDLAGQINDIVYTSVKRGDKFCSHLLSLPMMRAILRLKAFRMGTTAVSYTGPLNIHRNYGDIRIKKIHAFVSNFVLGPEYTAQTRLFDKQFYWDILYLDSDMNKQKAGIIADEIRSILDTAAKEEA